MVERMTNTRNDISPKLRGEAFQCPHCDVYAVQNWAAPNIIEEEDNRLCDTEFTSIKNIAPLTLDEISLFMAECERCRGLSIWMAGKMVYPLKPNAPEAHKEMPKDVKEIYEEARLVEPFSKRAAAALLRVSLEKLTEVLGEKKGSLHTRIAKLKKKGLSDEVIEALEIVHITASEVGSHAGVIDLENKDTPDIVNTLFDIVNFIVREVIAEPEKREKLREYVEEEKEEGKEKS